MELKKDLLKEMKKMLDVMDNVDILLNEIMDNNNKESDNIMNNFWELYPFNKSFKESELVGDVRKWVSNFANNIIKENKIKENKIKEMEKDIKIKEMEKEIEKLKKEMEKEMEKDIENLKKDIENL